MKMFLLAMLATSIVPSLWARTTNDLMEESLYGHYKKNILTTKEALTKSTSSFYIPEGLTPYEQTLFVDALWDLSEENRVEAFKMLDVVQPFHYDIVQKLRITILRMKFRGLKTISADLKADLENALKLPKVDNKLIYTLAAYEDVLEKAQQTEILKLASAHKEFKSVSLRTKSDLANDLISDLFFKSPDNGTFKEGQYQNTFKLFMFCRKSRKFPCLMVMRDNAGSAVRNEDGTLWTHKSLGRSASGKPSYKRNGNTPVGVMTIDSVMPEANMPLTYGANRRLILNFIEKSSKEKNIKSLLPESSHTNSWWRPGAVARDVGRNLLRIHGTGKINEDESTTYFPFRTTNGCISQRENTYGDIEYTDQRILLDSLMKALDLPVMFENELNIKGILYIVEIDDVKSPVEAFDLKLKGIE